MGGIYTPVPCHANAASYTERKTAYSNFLSSSQQRTEYMLIMTVLNYTALYSAAPQQAEYSTPYHILITHIFYLCSSWTKSRYFLHFIAVSPQLILTHYYPVMQISNFFPCLFNGILTPKYGLTFYYSAISRHHEKPGHAQVTLLKFRGAAAVNLISAN